MKHKYSFFNNLSIKNKLIISFLLVSIIPTVIIGIISYNISSNIVKEMKLNESIYQLNKINEKVKEFIKSKELIAIRFSINDNLRDILVNNKLDQKQYIKKIFDLEKMLYNYKYNEQTHSIYIFDNNQRTFTNHSKRSMTYAQLKSTDWFNEKSNIDNHFWGQIINIDGSYVIPYIRIIKDKINLDKIGYVQINIEEKIISDLYRQNQLDKNNSIYLLDENNNIISCQNKSYLGKNFSDIYKNDIYFNNDIGHFEGKINNKNYIFAYKLDTDNNWKYINIISIDKIIASSSYIKRYTIFVSMISIIICLAASMFLSSRITKPINKLINIIKKAEQGNLDVRFGAKYNDEIGRLAQSYDHMVSRLKNSIQEIFIIQRKKREAEYKAMEFQINPHFLYNTLSSIIWLSHNNQNKDVIRMTEALSKLFRISISKGKEIITIKEEIEHVKNYLEIQNIRYKDEFKCIYDIDTEILGFYTIKIILQPLVENAIYHGIRDSEYKGLIKITAKRVQDNIIMEVIDNGNGMSEQQVQKINSFLSGEIIDENFGIGIRNVNDRIRFYFKDNYGLKFYKDGIYTIARIKIPVVKEIDNV